MLSGAGHDAMNVARVAPTGMIFVPCKDGLSHNEAESATPAHLAAGAHTLLHTRWWRVPVACDEARPWVIGCCIALALAEGQ